MATFMVRADVADHRRRSTPPSPPAPTTLDESMPDAGDDARRVHAVLLLAHPGATPETPVARPAAHRPALPAHLRWAPTPDTEPGQIARLEGHGPVTEAWITRVLGPNAKFKINPVLDLAGQAPVDAYEIPTDIDRPCT